MRVKGIGDKGMRDRGMRVKGMKVNGSFASKLTHRGGCVVENGRLSKIANCKVERWLAIIFETRR